MTLPTGAFTTYSAVGNREGLAGRAGGPMVDQSIIELLRKYWPDRPDQAQMRAWLAHLYGRQPEL
jgi:hypothetical protein